MDPLSNELITYLMPELKKLKDLWGRMGMDDSVKQKRYKSVGWHLQKLLREMLSEEEQLETQVLKNIEEFRSQLLRLTTELGEKPYQPQQTLKVLQLERELRAHHASLTEEKTSRVTRLRELQDVDQRLCDVLCHTPYYVPSGSVPSRQQLDELEGHVARLQQEKATRLQQFRNTKQEIRGLVDDLEHGPDSSFQKDVLGNEEDSFLLNNDNMSALKHWHTQLEKQRQENFAVASDLRAHLATLWQRLETPENERAAFLAKHTGFRPTAISALRSEIATCENLKRQNLERFMTRIRAELVEWWDRCYYSVAQRNAFVYMADESLTEELLTVHEREVEAVKRYFEDNKAMLNAVSKREELFKQFIELERKANDPNRYNNRGGGLLKEEKERKRIQNQLPRLEQKLEEEIRMWEAAEGRKFLMGGLPFAQYVAHQWTTFQQEKEEEKQARHQAKEKLQQEEAMFGSRPVTPAKRRFLNTPAKTPNKTRRMNDTTRTPVSCNRTAAGFRTPASASKTQTSALQSPFVRAAKSAGPKPRAPRDVKAKSRARNAAHSQSSATPLRRSPRSSAACKTPTASGPYPAGGSMRVTRSRPPPPSQGLRKALSERPNGQGENASTLLSHTRVAGDLGHDNTAASIPPADNYMDFKKGIRPTSRSSVLPGSSVLPE